MEYSEIIDALTAARDGDAPTTRKATTAAITTLTEALEPLRERVDALSEALGEVENSAEELGEADAEDREDYYATLTGELDTVLEALAELAPTPAR